MVQTHAPTSHHHLPAHEVVLLLETDLHKGLTAQEAAQRLERFGPNVLPKFRRHGPLVRFLLQVHHPLIYVLLAATAVTAFLGEWVDAGVIFGTGFAPFRGGPMQHIRATGADALLARLQALQAKYGNRFAPRAGWDSPALRQPVE